MATANPSFSTGAAARSAITFSSSGALPVEKSGLRTSNDSTPGVLLPLDEGLVSYLTFGRGPHRLSAIRL
jgi:hypothetical protein